MQVADCGDEILVVSAITAANILSTVTGLSTTVTSYALDHNLTFPYVTIPHFDKHGDGFLKLAGAQYIGLCQIIKEDHRSEWESWSVQNQWIPEAYRPAGVPPNDSLIVPFIFEVGAEGLQPVVSKPDQTLYPVWQLSPTIPGYVNLDVQQVFPNVASSLAKLEAGEPATLSPPQEGEGATVDLDDPATWPATFLVSPVNDDFDRKGKLVAFISAIVPWHNFFENTLPDGSKGMCVIIRSTCRPSLTYQVNGRNVEFLGIGDLHDPTFDHLVMIGAFESDEQSSDNQQEGDCDFTLHVYPTTKELYDSSKSHNPVYFTFTVVLIFLLTSVVFVIYDSLVQQRQEKVMTSAQQSNPLVSSLFPAQVRDRFMGKGQLNEEEYHVPALSSGSNGAEYTAAHLLSTKPIADLFPNTTVLFADISGFTAWSSVREPSQVFTLLEQIYNSFDTIAKKKRIFKVETIGDCYVAATGLPEPREDHAVAMARFAHDCRHKMNSVVKKLEVLLGPDTADLSMRFGLHSGPVTAGVLRGEKSRFQLFGDTVNTAARMESTGARNKIHISQATADLLIGADKADWVKKRESMVTAKGKGLMQTYWLSLEDDSSDVTASNTHDTHIVRSTEISNELLPGDARTQRLIEWNVDVLQRQLQKIIAMRKTSSKKPNQKASKELEVKHPDGSTVLDEVREVIPLCTEAKTYRENPEDIELSVAVLSQLRDYVSAIAAMYQDNPFHSFEHASHVTQSVTKLLARVVTPESIDYDDLCYKKQGANDLHEYTYGITSDPLIQFACAFSALIHDADHTGLPNAQLVKENTDIAKMYKNKSVAEQNSVDIAWDLLMEPLYMDLRNCIYQSQDELERFRHLIVNAVMATDIADKEQAAFRKKRWEKAFHSAGDDPHSDSASESTREAVNRKATIVIEHLIQASDVSHTMQHWHVYLKWNERLFHEMYNAYLEGRAENDPSETWYQGELGFYDFYIIPLAKKLKDCGVFGVASDEYLDYATANRTEWEIKGKEIVRDYLMLHKTEQLDFRTGRDRNIFAINRVGGNRD